MIAAGHRGAPTLAAELRLVFLATLAICVVIPHSLQAVTAGMLAVTAALSLFVLRVGRGVSYVLAGYALSVIVTCLYIIIGVSHGAPDEAIYQTAAVYIVSPLLWIIIWNTALQRIPIEKLVRYLIYFTLAACATVALFFFLFLTRGPDAVAFFTTSANVDLREGYSAATMHVYGSLIFLCGALFCSPELIPVKYLRIPFLILLVAVAMTSGRSALILSIPVGLTIGAIVRPPGKKIVIRRLLGVQQLKYLLLLVGAIGIIALLDKLIDAINLSVILEAFWTKLIEGGGSARTSQASALIDGIKQSYGLGSGHGIGVALQRNDDYAWRYENVPLAIIFKTGLGGAFIYSIPFLITLWRYAQGARKNALNAYDKFMLAGFVSVLLGAWTNPYLESFIFQWMFILPMVYAEHRNFAHAKGAIPKGRKLA